MNFKQQIIGLVLLLIMSALSAVFWVVNVNQVQRDERVIQESTNLKFRFKEIRVSLYKSNTQVNNDEISNNLLLVDKSVESLIASLELGSKEYSKKELDLIRQKVKKFKHRVQKYQSAHALIKNSVAYTHVKYAEVLASHSKDMNVVALHGEVENVLFNYYSDTLDTAGQTFEEKKIYPLKVRLLLVHVRQILKQYNEIKRLKIDIEALSLEALEHSADFITQAKIEIKDTKEINEMMFISFVITTVWLLLYGFSSFIRAQKDYLEIRSLKNSLQQFVDALNRSAIVSKSDPQGLITYANEKFTKVSGYSQEELLGKPHSIVRHEDMPGEMFTRLWEEIRSNKTFHALIKNKTKDGKPYYVDTHISAILDIEGNITEYVAVRYDVTELVHKRDEALSAQKTKDKFLSTMSHELRTPLNAVIGFTELLQKSLKDPAYITYINNISDSAQDLLRLINDILDLAKIQSGKFMIVNSQFKVEPAFTTLIERYLAQAKESDIDLLCLCEVDTDLELHGDWLRISQVVSNLLSNALKFTMKKGKVESSIFYKQGELHIRIEDTGIGMLPEDIEKVFASFSQADDSTTRSYGGTGLGLSISKDLIEMMGGRFEVKSELNVGSVFNIYIPLIQGESKKIEEVSIDRTASYKGTVLIVEDNKTNQLMLSMMLDNFGLEYGLADNGQIAIDMYEDGKYDLILMDENMPVMGGTEAMIKLHELYKNLVPVVVVTANVVQGDREKFLESGMDDYVPKPIDEMDLRRVLAKYLEIA